MNAVQRVGHAAHRAHIDGRDVRRQQQRIRETLPASTLSSSSATAGNGPLGGSPESWYSESPSSTQSNSGAENVSNSRAGTSAQRSQAETKARSKRLTEWRDVLSGGEMVRYQDDGDWFEAKVVRTRAFKQSRLETILIEGLDEFDRPYECWLKPSRLYPCETPVDPVQRNHPPSPTKSRLPELTIPIQ